MLFRYQVLDKSKQLFQGELEAESVQRARLSLMQHGYDVLLLEEAATKQRYVPQKLRAIGRVSLKEKMLFVKHLSLMIKSGMMLDESIEVLHDQATGRMKSIFQRLLTVVRKGNFLSDGLKLFPYTFSDFFINMVRIGEQSGTLSENLVNLSVKLKKDHDLRSKIAAAMTYPLMVVFALGGLGLITSTLVLPKLLIFFESLHVTLPPTTRVFLSLAKFLENYAVLSAIGVVILGVLVVVINKFPATKITTHWLVFHLPLFHKFSKTSNLANFCRSMALLLKGGVTIDESLEIMGVAVNNVLYKKRISELLVDVRKGETLSSSLARSPKQFPMLVSKMIHVGELSGNFAETFEYLAEFYEDEMDYLSKNLASTIEPVLLIVIGLLVGFVAMAIISPIYQLTAGIR